MTFGRPRIMTGDVLRVVARHYRVDIHEMAARRRSTEVTRPRQIAIYLAKSLTLQSLPAIGRQFGGRHHTTILHAFRKVEKLACEDNDLFREVETLTDQIVAEALQRRAPERSAAETLINALDAALNQFGFELAVVPIGTRDHDGLFRKTISQQEELNRETFGPTIDHRHGGDHPCAQGQGRPG